MDLNNSQPFLKEVSASDSCVVIRGKYVVHAEMNGEPFSDSFMLEITIDDKFPRTVPKVKELEKRITPYNYNDHIYQDQILCLEVDTRMIIELDGNPTLSFFSERFVFPYLLGFLYYQKHGIFPFDDYSHGKAGLLEYYCAIFDVDDKYKAKQLLGLILKNHFPSHNNCPCESGKLYKDCHYNQVNRLRDSKFIERYVIDYYKVSRWSIFQKQS